MAPKMISRSRCQMPILNLKWPPGLPRVTLGCFPVDSGRFWKTSKITKLLLFRILSDSNFRIADAIPASRAWKYPNLISCSSTLISRLPDSMKIDEMCRTFGRVLLIVTGCVLSIYGPRRGEVGGRVLRTM